MAERASAGLSNGAGAAAILAAALGCFFLGVLSLAGDASPAVASALIFWKPTGPLSGVTDVSIIIWLLAWYILNRLWARRAVDLRKINTAAILLFAGGLLLTFPPFMDVLQGK